MVTLVSLRAYKRFVVVVWHFLPLLFAYARDRRRFLLVGGRRSVNSATRVRRAERLLDSLLTLGPTFIKLGQLLSTRPDVLPPEYVDVISQLQDEVPPAPWDEARAVVESELGPVDEHFHDFDTEAISGASLGQVYRASIDGQDVAVKIRRPGVEALVEADLRVVRWSLPILLRFVDEARAFSLENLADEFGTVIRQEMDYEREARMLTEIRHNFTDDERIRIPPVIESHSGPTVLTMQYLPGTKITDVETLDAKGIDRSQVADQLVRAYFQMIVEDGVYHADPHPGNLAVQDDGGIVFYDFGMSGRVDDYIQDRIVEFYVAVANQDIDALLDALIAIGTLSPDADREVMSEVMELAIKDARGQDVDQYRVQQIVSQIEGSIYEFPFRLPPNLALVLRVATVVEGVCVTLDQDFDFIESASAFLTERGYREETVRQYLSETGDEVQDAALSMLRVPPKLESALDRVDRESLTVRTELRDPQNLYTQLARRMIYGMVLATGLLSAAILYAVDEVAGVLVALGITFVAFVVLFRSFREPRGIPGKPQFTRQAMREQDREED
ncbi:MAG: putative unusual protein kinase regulating ubiquinone biosynthesis (AarF/ABC1/UbiB family) [Halobacteriales archaeon]